MTGQESTVMSPPGQVIVRRLRAHKLIPANAPAVLVSGGTLASRSGKLQWRAVNPATGEEYGVGSYFPQKLLAASRHWGFTAAGGMTLLRPGGGDG